MLRGQAAKEAYLTVKHKRKLKREDQSERPGK
jgi:hypothetical protein